MNAIDRFLPPQPPTPLVKFLGLRIGVWVPTCWHYRFRADLCRRHWQPRCEKLGWQVVFFDCGEDTRIMDYREQKFNLCNKMFDMYCFAYDSQYDYVIKADTDTMLWPERINFDRYLNHDYIGGFNLAPSYDRKFPYAHGGCYILSRKAIGELLENPADWKANPWGEDEWVGATMIQNGIKILHEPRMVWNQQWDDQKFISWHDFGNYQGAKKGCPYIALNERKT